MMCAFMTPVLKEDWEIYNTKKSRSGSSSPQKHAQIQGSRSRPNDLRRRCLLEHRSLSYHSVPIRNESDLSYIRHQQQRGFHTTKNSRCSSRSSLNPVPETQALPNIPRKEEQKLNTNTASNNSLTKFHNKVIDKLKKTLHIKDKSEDDHGAEDEPLERMPA